MLTSDCDSLRGFFLHTAPLCFAHKLSRVILSYSEFMTQGCSSDLLEDHFVFCQEHFSVARRIDNSADHFNYITLREIIGGKYIYDGGDVECYKKKSRIVRHTPSIGSQSFSL